MPKISVIIPVYNAEKYIKRCLNALTSQTLSDIELIFVDDRSSDNSVQIIRNYADRDNRIKLFCLSGKMGAGGARNVGLEKACGEYIGFCDADDVVELQMFQEMYEQAVFYDADITACGINTYYEDCLISKDVPSRTDCYTSEKIFRHLKYGSVWNKIFKQDLAKSIRFSENRFCEDSVYTLKLLCKCRKFLVINKAYYNYFINIGSSTNNRRNTEKWEDDKCFSLFNLYNYCIENNVENAYLKGILSYCQKNFNLNYNNKSLRKNFFKLCKSYDLRKTLFKEYAVTNRILFIIKAYFLFPIYVAKIYQLLKRAYK